MENNNTAEIFLHFAAASGAEVKSLQTSPTAGGASEGHRRPEEDRELKAGGFQISPIDEQRLSNERQRHQRRCPSQNWSQTQQKKIEGRSLETSSPCSDTTKLRG